jgi:TPR repeat protein
MGPTWMPIIPFRVDPIMPSKALSYFILSAQWLEGQPPPVERYLDALVAAVRYQLTPVKTAERTAPAPSRSGAAARRRWKLVTIGVAACVLVVGATRALHWSVLGFGLGEPSHATSLAACGSAYGAGQWSGALAHCVDVAAAGNFAAQRLVAAIYWRGLGVARNPGRGTAWLQRAAHQGDEESRARLRTSRSAQKLSPPARRSPTQDAHRGTAYPARSTGH